jgi:hypothetical protein
MIPFSYAICLIAHILKVGNVEFMEGKITWHMSGKCHVKVKK